MLHRPALILTLVALTTALGACGGGSNGGTSPKKAAAPARFPAAGGETFQTLARRYRRGPILAPAVSDLQPGSDRFAFGLFTASRKLIAQAPAALYVSTALNAPVRGPLRADFKSLVTPRKYESKTVATDPNAARGVYATSIRFPGPGTYGVMALVRLGGRLVATAPVGVKVVRNSPVPQVGERAPRISTPTVKSVHGDVAKIDTRVPPDDIQSVNYADVYGKRPIVIAFATPALCESRTCGPVVDIAEQVKDETDGDAVFIHNEVYVDNDLNKGYRPQLRAFHLSSEPWVFAIDRRGRIAARLEGPFGADELRAAVRAAEAG